MSELHKACEKGYLEQVTSLLTSTNINTQNTFGETPLFLASKHAHLDTVKVLVGKKECDLNIPDEQGNTSLHMACKCGYHSIVELLVSDQRCQSINTQNRKGEIPLLLASKYGSLNTVKVLASRKECDFNIPNGKGNTPLHGACMYGHYSIVEFLVADRRCQLNTQNREGETPLHIASEQGDLDTIKALLRSEKCNLNITDESGNTPLHSACKNDDTKALKAVRLLLARKCSTNIPNEKGETAWDILLNEDGDSLLHFACHWGDTAIVRYLITDERCNPNVTNASSSTPLHIASKHGHLDVVKFLISRKECDFSIRDERGNTPLHIACKHGHHTIVELLVADQRCNSVNTQNGEGKTALHIASHQDDINTIKTLIRYEHCDLNIADEKGNTPLHSACKHGHHTTVELLVADQRCHSVNTQNGEGKTALHIASEQDDVNTIKTLIHYEGCDLNIADEKGNTPLHSACKHGHHSTVQFLVADPRCQLIARNNDANTPMHLACFRKALSVVKLLLGRRCITNVPNKKGETVQEIPLNEDGDYLLHVACGWGDVDVIKYLVTDQSCDPNVLNRYDLTPLLATIKCGKPCVVTALLQHSKCDLSLRDKAGNTALHLACISGQSQPKMVKIAKSLIVSVDPFCVNSAGQTPIELTTNYELIQAISHFTKCKTKHSVQTYINLFIVGNPETGKSTLVKAICKEANTLLKILPKHLRRVKNVPPHTAGIIPTTFQSKTFGNTILYDLAGQIEYYTSHAAVIQTTVISTPPAFIVVVNMSESEEKISETVRYWWSFINNHAACSSIPPQVILVGSHPDKVKARGGNVQEKMSQMSSLLKCLPSSFYFAGHIALDCRDPASRKLQLFCSLVNNICCELRQTADVDLRCHVLYAFLLDKFPGRVACTILDIATIIRESDALLPQNPDRLIPLISALSDKGLLLLVRDSESNEDSWVILQKQALLGEINGTVFAPKDFSQHKNDLSSSTGVVSLCKLKREFPDYNPTMIANFLTHLEFCFKVDDQETLELLKGEIVHEENMSESLSEEYYFFPALVSVENPLQVWEQDDVMICQCGWYYRCIRHDQFLTTHFLHILILRLAFSFALQVDPGDYHEDSLALCRRCSVWKHGIGWLNRVPIETVVEIGLLNQSVIVMMRCPKGEEAKCAQLRSEIIQKVIEAKDEHCKAVKMSESFIHPTDIKYPFTDNTEDLKYYSLSEIARATIKEAYNVLDYRGRNPFPVKDLLLFDPQNTTSRELLSELFSEKHSLEKQVHGQVLEKLLQAPPQQVVAIERVQVGETTGEAGSPPTLHELLNFPGQEKKINIPQEIGTQYKTFGTILLEDDSGARVDNIVHEYRERAERINTEILQEWLTGRGKQPVTWETLVEVLYDIELSILAGVINTSKCVSEL